MNKPTVLDISEMVITQRDLRNMPVLYTGRATVPMGAILTPLQQSLLKRYEASALVWGRGPKSFARFFNFWQAFHFPTKEMIAAFERQQETRKLLTKAVENVCL